MTLSQPPPVAPWRAYRSLSDGSDVPPGQQLPRCAGHRLLAGARCYAGSGGSLVADETGWQPGYGMPNAVMTRLRDACWLTTRRTKNRPAEWRHALRWRRDHIENGYRNLAEFEAAAHWWLCITPAAAAGLPVADVCTCPAEYLSWWDHTFANHNGPLPGVMFAGAEGTGP